MGDTDSSEKESDLSLAHVSVKPAPFYKRSPETWFRRLESQFSLAKISNPVTMFHHVLAVLPEELACDLDFPDTNYETLKKAVLDHLKANKHELIEQALSTLDLGDKRPSQFVTEVKRRFSDIGLTADDDIVKSRLLKALPAHLRSALVGHDSVSLDQYAKIADSMLSVSISTSPFVSVNSVSSEEPRKTWHRNDNFDKPSQRNNQRSNQRSFAVRPFYSDQRPKLCNAHIFYAERARTCRPWCRWPGKKGQSLKDHQQTPAQSRSSSPTNL